MSKITSEPSPGKGEAEPPRASGKVIGATTRATAVCMLSLGLWPIPVYPKGADRGKNGIAEGKEPIGPAWGAERNTLDSLNRTFRKWKNANIGVGIGPGRGPGGAWLIDLEIDGPQGVASLAKLLGGATVVTLGWSSARGGHILLIVDAARMTELLRPLKGFEGSGLKTGVYHLPEFPDLEIRIGGFKADGSVKQVQSVFPPSPGTDGKPREWNGVETIASAPESLYEALRAAATPEKPEPRPSPASSPETEPTNGNDAWEPMTVTSAADRPAQWLARALVNAAGRVANAREGTRHPTLLAETRALAGYLHYGIGFSENDLESAMKAAADRAAPGRASNAGTVRDAIGFGKAAPLYLPDDLHRLATTGPDDKTEAGSTAVGPKPSSNGHATVTEERLDYRKLTRAELGLKRASDIDAEPVDFFWEDRIPLGMLTLLAGEGDDGKSMITIALAAAASNGGKLPDGSQAPLCRVVILAAEDSARKTIIPRLIAAGANMANVDVLTAKITYKDRKGRTVVSPQCLADLDYWRALFEKADEGQPRQGFFIVDTLPSMMKGVNDSRNNEIRALMEPFIDEVLDPMNVAMLGVTHLNKSIDHKTPVNKILGSVAYPNLSRSVFCTYRDDDDTTQKRRFMCHIKMNVGERGQTLAYSIEKAGIESKGKAIKIAKVVFEESPVDLSAQDILNGKRGKRGPDAKKTAQLAEWLFDLLTSEKHPVPLGAIFDAAGLKGLIGQKKTDGRWSSGALLYQARERVPALGTPREGKRIEDIKAPAPRGKRDVVHWFLVSTDAAF